MSEDKGQKQTIKSDVVEKPPTQEVTASQREEKILKFWQDNKIFEKSLQKESPNGDFVFYDGPPFATGMPHYGHILPGTIKDVIPRYETMKGKQVLRRWGWDCHGLPIENLIEKELGLKTKKDIEALGVDKFNLAARNVVFRYADEWKKIIPRSGRWVDMENDYRTMDTSYTESVWWAFKNLYDKGLVYKGFKSMYLCPRCETTLSNFEVNQGYKDVTDISVYAKFELVDEENTFALAWTTTPWTLPGNVALAVNKDVTYVKVLKDGANLILAKDLAEKVLKENYEIVEEFSGKKLVGKEYKPLFTYYDSEKLENRKNAWKIYSAEFVTVEDGTGIVHIAPAFGEDDMNLGKEEKLPFVQHVKTDGTFKDEVMDFVGLHVKPIEDPQKTDIEIIKYLAKHGTLFAKEKIIHSYPHCWRCNTPLLNYATSSWFIKVTDIKDRLVELNKTINWIPEDIGQGRFGKWLEGGRDWAISRSRYWGAPLPVWETTSGERVIIGSIDELKDRIGRKNKYFLMRHGQSEANINGDTISSKDFEGNPLTEEGRKKAFASGDELRDKKIDVIITSPFLRTRQTAEIVAGAIGYDKKDIVIDERLREVNGGDFEGKPWNEFLDKFSSTKERFEKSLVGNETWGQVLERVMGFMYDIDTKYEGKNILVVGHGSPLNLILLGSKGFSEREVIKHYSSRALKNAEVMKCDFVSLPHNEKNEVDLHRPYIDTVSLTSEYGNPLQRVPEVFDCWLESGSMSFAQQHYPFEHKDVFLEKDSPLYPAELIAEGQDQTRGWFYTSLVLSVALFDRIPYKNVVVNGLVLAEDGRKMSKSLNNYPDVMDVMNKYGADSLRYYLVSSPVVKANDLNFSEKGVDEISKKIIQKIYNVVSFYEMYKTDFPEHTSTVGSTLDNWISSRLTELLDAVTKGLDSFELDRASRPIMDFVDDLSTWYLRRSRDRFKSDDINERQNVSRHMAFVLSELSKIVAPFMPFLAEEVYQRVKPSHARESVHLEDWPVLDETPRYTELIETMKKVREVVTGALELRQKAGMKVRQPLASLTIPYSFSDECLNIIADEVNVKKINVAEGQPLALDTELTPELKEEGIVRDIIRGIQDVRKKENLNPSDEIKLIVSAHSDIVALFKVHLEMIKSPTGVKTVEFSEDAQTHKVALESGEMSLAIVH
ncbi:MAG: class I tRNA ligase family protein [bacterium]